MRACSSVTEPLPLRLPISDAALRPCPLTDVRADTRPAGIDSPRCFSAAPSTPSSCTRPVSATPSGDLRADRSACSFPPPSPAVRPSSTSACPSLRSAPLKGRNSPPGMVPRSAENSTRPRQPLNRPAIERLGAVVARGSDRNQQRRRHVKHVGADAAFDAGLVAQREAELAAHARAAERALEAVEGELRSGDGDARRQARR